MEIILTPATNNFYQQQAQEQFIDYNGLSAGYYDHFVVDIQRGIFEFARYTKNEPTVEPFNPSDNFSLRSKSGEHITHSFVALEVIPVGYFIGAALSNYEQQLPNERKGAHCETVKAELNMGENKEVVIGRYPLQSSQNITYGFRKYDKNPDAAGVYAGQRYMSYGKATPEYAAQVGRPEVMSCGECLGESKDKYLKNKCRTVGQMVVFVKRVAIKGAENKLIWLDVSELNIEGIDPAGFIAVLKVGASDLRKPDYSPGLRANHHIAPNATFAHEYVTTLYRTGDPALVPVIKTEYGVMQTLAYPTQIWCAELTTSYGANKFTALYNQAPSNNSLGLEESHLLLKEAVTAYFRDKDKKKADKAASLNLISDVPSAQPAATGNLSQYLATAQIPTTQVPTEAKPEVTLSSLMEGGALFGTDALK
jgi:hypothetical protein